jgi:hypothetical protein
MSDLIPTGPADAARKIDPSAVAVHCLDAGVIVHGRVDEPPLAERHRDDQAGTHVGMVPRSRRVVKVISRRPVWQRRGSDGEGVAE